MNQVGINYGAPRPTARTAVEPSVSAKPATAKKLGLAIGDARRRQKMTQQELCAAADISYSTLAKIERGAIRTPSVFTVIAIAEVLEVSVEELAGGKTASKRAHTPPKARQTSKSGVQFVYFDVNGVLVRFFQRAFNKLSQDTGASATAIESTFWHYNDAVCRGEMSLADFNRVLAQHIGQTEVNWQKYYMESVEPVTEMQTCLQETAEHYQVGLMSNIMPGFLSEMMARGVLPSLDYAAVFDSSELGLIKPEPQAYHVATEKAGVPPEAILLIDDSRTNLMAAEHQGWQVLWFDDFLPQESIERVKNALEF